MNHQTLLARLATGLALLCLALPLQAQQYERVDNYQIHYSAVSTSFLTEEVAAEHNIQRSPAMAVLNVSVLEELEDGSTRPVNAQVDGQVGDIGGQAASPLSFRSLRDGDSISQIAVFRIHDDEPMRFELDVRYDRNREPASVNFIQRFYINR